MSHTELYETDFSSFISETHLEDIPSAVTIEGPHISQRTFQFTSLTLSTANPPHAVPDSTPEYPVT
jgi:hypothetical protein